MDDLSSKVLNWLERTGFPLEMRVAEAARRSRPLFVRQSSNYVDPSSGVVRETDVVVGWRDPNLQHACHVYLVLECKAKPAPWVIFDDGGLPKDDADRRLGWTVQRTPRERGTVREAYVKDEVFSGDTLFRPSRVRHGVLEVTFADSKSHERNPAWDAVRSCVAAAHGVLAEFDTRQIQQNSAVLLGIPVVVTSGKLFRAFLQDGELKVEEVDEAELLVRPGQALDQTRCLIVNELALPGLFARAAATPSIVGLHQEARRTPG